MSFLAGNSAVWNDDAVRGALDSAALWAKDLPFVKSLSGYWKFHLASCPEKVPKSFYDVAFRDSEWDALPGEQRPDLVFCFRFRNDYFFLL